jgi:C1A family cysteine protease
VACYRSAKKHQILSYHRITTVDEMRGCLAEGFPFVFGFTAYEALESAAVGKSGVLTMPGPKEKMVGGHAVMGVGYDDAARRFVIRNSWGADWGQKAISRYLMITCRLTKTCPTIFGPCESLKKTKR